MPKVPTEIKSLARSHTEMAIKSLATIARRGKTESARVAACQVLLDRGWGKPTQPISGDEDGDPIKLVSRIERVLVPVNGGKD